MLDKIAKKIGAIAGQVPMSLKNFGNTSSASIPLTIVTECRNEYSERKVETIACGFGTGLSWGIVHFVTDKILCPKVVVY